MTMPARRFRPLRGGPLVMLVLVLTGWSAARAIWWENPFVPLAASLGLPREMPLASPAPAPVAVAEQAEVRVPPLTRAQSGTPPLWLAASVQRGRQRQIAAGDPRLAAAHRFLWLAALRDPISAGRSSAEPAGAPFWGAAPPFLPPVSQHSVPANPPADAGGGRWSVDAWAFWRQGSDAAPVSQGRVPIYGASQAGAVLQYRLAPGSARDPRLYARAYRALVRRGESELAVGASARPFAQVPLRAAGEVRYTDAAFSDTFRPAAYVVTELPPVELAYGAQLEAYGQAGWVGGPDPTGFADGQASITGEVRPVANLTGNALRLSLGAGAWGGAQNDAQRIDIGPTLRLDLDVGEVPARVSVDWRERVAGDASPGSGLAATISTRF